MEKVLDRLGIYDLFVNFITGIAMLSMFVFLCENLYGFYIADQLKKIEIWIILIIAYFIGILFQECSNFIETALFRISHDFKDNKKIRGTIIMCFIPSVDRVLMKTDTIKERCGDNKFYKFFLHKKVKRDLDDTEIDFIRTRFNKEVENGVKDTEENIYNYCKIKIRKSHDTYRFTNDQSHASMARSLALFSFVILVFTFVWFICGKIVDNRLLLIITLITSFLSFLLFLRRNKRFSEMRYVNVFRSFIYAFDEKEQEKISSKETVIKIELEN